MTGATASTRPSKAQAATSAHSATPKSSSAIMCRTPFVKSSTALGRCVLARCPPRISHARFRRLSTSTARGLGYAESIARLADTDLDVHPLCLGGNVFGWTLDEE